jgi:hypothetical protein
MRMKPIRANDEIEAARERPLERHVHAPPILGERGNGVSEDEFSVVPACVMEGGGEIAARQLDVPAVNRSPHVEIDASARIARLIQESHSRDVGAGLAQSRYEVHLFDHPGRRPADVDGASA